MYAGSCVSLGFLKVINDEINKCQFRIEETNKSIVESKELTQKLLEARSNQEILNNTVMYAKDKRKKLVEYNAKKKERSMQAIYSAIYSARTIIPGTTPLSLNVTREEASLINDQGDDIDLVEGSAFRAVLSLFVRCIILRNTDYMQSMSLDEPLTTLSPESSATFSKYLPILAQDMQIILIEQKNEIFTDAEGLVYYFTKSEGKTKVRRSIP